MINTIWRHLKKGASLNLISFALALIILRVFKISLFPITSMQQLAGLGWLLLVTNIWVEGYFIEKINEWIK